MTIDAHIHLYPPTVYKDPTGWADRKKEPYWRQLVAPESGPVLQGWASVDQLLLDMDAAEVEQAVILGWYWEQAETCDENIAWQQEWIAQHPDRLIAFAPFNAKGGPASIDSLKRAFDKGFRGIGELNPPAQGYAYDNEILDAALELAGQESRPVNFHVTDPNTHDYAGKIETPFDSLCNLAKRHPSTPLVFAHLAGMMELSQLKALDNVYLDTAAVPLLYESSIYQTAIDQVGSDRILFGTDYPLRTFPKSQRKPEFQSHLNSIRASGIPAPDLEKILRENMKRLI